MSLQIRFPCKSIQDIWISGQIVLWDSGQKESINYSNTYLDHFLEEKKAGGGECDMVA